MLSKIKYNSRLILRRPHMRRSNQTPTLFILINVAADPGFDSKATRFYLLLFRSVSFSVHWPNCVVFMFCSCGLRQFRDKGKCIQYTKGKKLNENISLSSLHEYNIGCHYQYPLIGIQGAIRLTTISSPSTEKLD